MELKIVFEKGALFEFWVDRFVAGGDFQVLGVFDEQVDKSALGADPRLEGNLFLDAMVFADDHDQFQVSAGAKADLPLEDAFRAAFTAGVGIAHTSLLVGDSGLRERLGALQTSLGSKIDQARKL